MRNLLTLFLLFPFVTFGQTVKNIRTSQYDSKIKIQFNIENTTDAELLSIGLKCIVNDKFKIDVDSAEGDIGHNIIGGKDEYMVIWDVLAQVDELTSAEFIIRVEKQSFYKSTDADFSHPWFVSYNSGFLYTPVGARIGYLNNWGGFAAVRYSNKGTFDHGNGIKSTELYSLSLGVSKFIFASNDLAIHAYAAGGIAKWGNYNEVITDPNDVFNSKVESGDDMEGTEIEVGALIQAKRWLFGVGIGINSGKYGSDVDLIGNIGYRF